METMSTGNRHDTRYTAANISSKEAGGAHTSVRSTCWYCSKPVSGVRHYCGPECREAMFDDNDFSRQRRRIFGCEC